MALISVSVIELMTNPMSRLTSPQAPESPAVDPRTLINDQGSEDSRIPHLNDQDQTDDPLRIVQPLSAEALAEFNAAQERAGVVYISRIPPGMRPTKVRHLMSAHGQVGRVYLQQEGLMATVVHCFAR